MTAPRPILTTHPVRQQPWRDRWSGLIANRPQSGSRPSGHEAGRNPGTLFVKDCGAAPAKDSAQTARSPGRLTWPAARFFSPTGFAGRAFLSAEMGSSPPPLMGLPA